MEGEDAEGSRRGRGTSKEALPLLQFCLEGATAEGQVPSHFPDPIPLH